MIRFVVLVGLLALWLQPSLVIAGFEQQEHKLESARQIELKLGESYYLTLSSENAQRDYESLDLSGLAEFFVLDDSAQTSQRIRLRLTPIQVGNFTQPGLVAGDLHVPAMEFKVLPNPEVAIQWQKSADKIYQNQAVSWQISVELQDVGLPVRLVENAAKNLIINPQAISQNINKLNKTKGLKFVQAEIFPKAGRHNLQLPAVEVQTRRGDKWLFYPAPQQVEVLPIPSYLPAKMPAGNFAISLHRPVLIKRGDLQTVNLNIKAINHNYLPNLAQSLQISTDEQQIEWLTAKVLNQQQLGLQGLLVEQQLQLPIRVHRLGFGKFAAFSFQYLDPVTGKLAKIDLPATVYLALPAWLIYLGVGFLLALVLALFIAGFKYIKIAWYNCVLRLNLWRATRPVEIWVAYRNWGKDRGFAAYQTHQAWLQSYQQKFGATDKFTSLASLMQQLERQIYMPKADV